MQKCSVKLLNIYLKLDFYLPQDKFSTKLKKSADAIFKKMGPDYLMKHRFTVLQSRLLKW